MAKIIKFNLIDVSIALSGLNYSIDRENSTRIKQGINLSTDAAGNVEIDLSDVVVGINEKLLVRIDSYDGLNDATFKSAAGVVVVIDNTPVDPDPDPVGPLTPFQFTVTGQLVAFHSLNAGSAFYQWQDGDGNNSADKDREVHYMVGGTYPAKLTTDKGSITQDVVVPHNTRPTADFSFVINQQTAVFTNLSTDAESALGGLLWDFGDNVLSSGNNPSHTFNYGGYFDVTLLVRDQRGAWAKKTKRIRIPSNLALPGWKGWDRPGLIPPHKPNNLLTVTYGFQPWSFDPMAKPVPAGNSHYIDPSHPNATDTNNANGTEAKPRLTIPSSITAGSVMFIRGEHTWNAEFTAMGTELSPCFMHGDGVIVGDNTVHADAALMYENCSYLIIDGIEFSGELLSQTSKGNGAFFIQGGSHHVCMRNCIIHSFDDPFELTDANGVGIGRSAFHATTVVRYAEHIIMANCVFSEIGRFPPVYETGNHCLAGGQDTNWIWNVDCRFADSSEDAIQIRAADTSKPTNRFWMIYNADIESMGENAIDIKTGENTLIGFSDMADFPSFTPVNGSGSDGAAIVLNDDNGGPINTWIYNCRTYRGHGRGGSDGTVGVAVRCQADGGSQYIFGNVFAGSRLNAIFCSTGSAVASELNTVYKTEISGFFYNSTANNGVPSYSPLNGNIVSELNRNLSKTSGDSAGLYLNQHYMETWDNKNVLHDSDGTVVNRGGTPTKNIFANPLLKAPGLGRDADFTLQPGSPAAGILTEADLVCHKAFESVFGFMKAYGIPANVDRNGVLIEGAISAGAFQ